MSVRDTTKRLFIAVDLSVSVVENLARLQRELAQRLSGASDATVRWTEGPNIHVTLKFIGETEAALLPMIEERLAKLVRPLFPFEVRCQGVGAFPDLERARIVWAGLDPKGAEVMGLLRLSIERELGELGFETDEREYRPHVTLGRLRAKAPVDMTELVEDLDDLSFGDCYVRDLVLFESTLTPDGPRYEVINRFQLGEP